MPRKALVLITALVLALHAVLLMGVPLAWEGGAAAPPAGPVFAARLVAAPAPATPAATPAPAPAAPPAPRQRPRTAPPAAAPVAEADAAGQPAPPAAAVADTSEPTPPAAAEPTPEPATTDAVTSDTAPPDSSAATTPEPAAQASAVDASGTTAGLQIRAPGDASARTATGLPVRIPPPTRLQFDVTGQAKRFDYSARAELLWQHDGERYEARQEISLFLLGSRAQRSRGRLGAEGLVPERFSDRNRSEQAAHFDHEQGRVRFSANTPDAPIGPGAQDRLSLFVQLGALLAANPTLLTPGTELSLTTVSARGADRWTLSVEALETLDLPAGPTPAWKLLRQPRREYDQRAELWLAPSLGYLPARIRLTQANGDFADLQLRESGPP